MSDYFDRILGAPLELQASSALEAANLQQDNWTPSLSEQQLSDVFDNGSSLNIYLRPSSNISKREGTETYIENYALPVIIKEQDRYLASTAGGHVDKGLLPEILKGGRSYYGYSNCGSGFFNWVPSFTENGTEAHFSIMNKVSYEEMEWIVKDTHDLVFEGVNFQENVDVIKAIHAGKDFRISLTLPDGRQFRLEMDLLFYYPESQMTNGHTHGHFYPAALGSPVQFHSYSVENFLTAEGKFSPEMAKDAHDLANSTLFWVYGDGTYANSNMALKGKRESFTDIKIFASKL